MSEFAIEIHLVACATAFLLGSLPFGLWISRGFGIKDIREVGSGNIGATNVARGAGWKAGALTFVLDAAKGTIAVLIFSTHGLHDWLAEWAGTTFEPSMLGAWLIGLFAILGHCFSPWLNFKGGKGVSTTFGILLVLSPVAAISGLLVYSLIFYEKRIGSVASLAGLSVAAVSHLIVEPIGAYCWIGAAIFFLIVLRHENNLDALLEGGEPHFD